MTPKEFQKSNLAVELKAEKKRLEDALHGLSDEQCERPGATQFGSVMDLLSEIVTGELALMEVSSHNLGKKIHYRDCDWKLPSAPTLQSQSRKEDPLPNRTESHK